MGPYTAIVGLLVFILVVGAIGAVDVVRSRRQVRNPREPSLWTPPPTPAEPPRTQPTAHAR